MPPSRGGVPPRHMVSVMSRVTWGSVGAGIEVSFGTYSYGILRAERNIMSRDTVAVASDHAGFTVKSEISELLHELGYDVLDLGADSADSVDYPDFANAMAEAFTYGRVDRGVLICGTGIGISIAANRHRQLRAARCCDATDARLSRQHNDANVLVLGSRTGGLEQARDCVFMFLGTEFEGGRHQRRVKKMS